MSLADVRKSFEELKKLSSQDGAQVELSLLQAESFSSVFQKGKLHKYSANDSSSATVRVVKGHSEGFSTTENLSFESLQEAYREAMQSALDLSASKTANDSPILLSKNNAPKMPDLLNLEFKKISTEEKIEKARILEKSALEYDSRVQAVTYSGYGESVSTVALMNSLGLDLNYQSSGISAYSWALSKEGEDLKSAGVSKFSRSIGHINAKDIGEMAAKKSVSLLGAVQPKSGTYAVVFENEVAASLIDFINGQVSAKSLDEGRSLLKGKENQKIFSDLITIEDDPFSTELPGARPFDSEGAASQKTSIIEKGFLKNFLTNAFYARKLKLPHTANAVCVSGEMTVGPSNTVVRKGNFKFEELLASHKEVILITEITGGMHSGFKEATLDFSLPANGFRYVNGKRANPVHQFVMSGNLLEILKNVEKLSDRTNDDGSSVVAPDLLVSGISIAGAN